LPAIIADGIEKSFPRRAGKTPGLATFCRVDNAALRWHPSKQPQLVLKNKTDAMIVSLKNQHILVF
jgi:hypothetical protein